MLAPAIMAGLAILSAAQHPAPRYYFGEQFTTLRTFEPRGLGSCFCFYPGFGVRFGFNSNRFVALEAELDYFPRRGKQLFERSGLDITEVTVGLRPGYRWRRFGVFYKLAPGLIDFSNDFQAKFKFPTGPISFGVGDRQAFLLRDGVVLEFYLSRRYAVRLDVDDSFVYLTEQGYPGVSPFDFLQPEVDWYHNLQVSVGVVFRVWR